ncbi:MAG: tripartite tricarboxylate transporter TctB family protein [Arenicella sp.]
MDRRKIDVVVTSLLIMGGIIILTNDNLSSGGIEATSLGSLFLPRLVAIFLIVFSAFIGLQSLMKIRTKQVQLDDEKISLAGFMGVNIYVALFIAYWFLTPYVGFLIATPFIMLAIAFLLGGKNWWAMIAVSLITTCLVFYGCKHFLRVFLPTWSLS